MIDPVFRLLKYYLEEKISLIIRINITQTTGFQNPRFPTEKMWMSVRIGHDINKWIETNWWFSKDCYLRNNQINRKDKINLPGNVPPNGEIKVGEINEEINATIAYGVQARVNVTRKKIIY